MLLCPSCGGHDVLRSHSRGLFDSLMSRFGKVPFRCRACTRRFYQYSEDEVGEPKGKYPAAIRRRRAQEVTPKRRSHETDSGN